MNTPFPVDSVTASVVDPVDWKLLKTRLTEANSFHLISHVRPDGDAIGSQMTLALALKSLGKKVLMINSDPLPATLTWLDPEGQIGDLDSLTPEQRAEMDSVDLLVTLDTSSWAQLGKMADVVRNFKGRKIVIDHHAKGDDIGAERFVDPDSEATGSLIFRTLQELGLPLTREYAFPLFAAIATDTGWFRFSSVTSETYRKVAALVDAGVRPDELYKIIYEKESLGRLRLMGIALAKTEPFWDNKALFTSLLNEDFERAEAFRYESEDIVNMPLTVDGTLFSVIMVEQKEGGFKLSFRSRCEIDCSLVAARFGGGGHKKAAGASLNLPYEEGKQLIIDTIMEFTRAKQ